jgi:undecaprenyl-diphosphatase
MRLPSLGRHALFILGALSVLALALAFTLVASEVKDGDTQGFDRAFLVALRADGNPADAWGPEWVEDWVRDITALGSAAVLILMTAAAAGFLAFRRQFHALLLLLVSMVGGIGVSTLLKGLFMRTRPDLVAVPEHLSTSFPSGHSMMAAVGYLTLGLILSRFVKPLAFKVYVITVAAVLTALVGFSRMYMAVHYPSDVLAGWIAGLAWAGLCFLAAEWLQRRGAVEKEQ